jgi:hypothetical protein
MEHRPINYALWIIVSNGAIELALGILLPPPTGFFAVGAISLLFGFSIYFLTYRMTAHCSFWREIRLFLVALAGNTLGSGMLFITCRLAGQVPVCAPENFQGQIFGNYFFPMVFLFLGWMIVNLPRITKMRNH